MNKIMRKTILIYFMIMTGFLNMIIPTFYSLEEAGDLENLKAEKTVKIMQSQVKSNTYSLKDLVDGNVCFTNNVDGYSLIIPSDLDVDMEMSDLRALLKNDQWQIEIYREELADGIEVDTYIQYSNGFIKNDVDHKKELQEVINIDGKPSTVLQWSREKLKRVKGDKNYYASVDIVNGINEVYTLLFKSKTPFNAEKPYLKIAESFVLTERKAEGDMVQFQGERQPDWNDETKAVFDKYFHTESSFTWGIFEANAPEDFTSLKKLEARLGYQFPLLICYKHFQKEGNMHNLDIALENAKREGRVPELTLQTTAQADSKGNMVYDILNGEYDFFLDRFIKEVKKAKIPILMRLCNEMNGDWCTYSSYHTSKDTEIYQELYRYVFKKFKEKGASQYAIWVWNPNAESFPNFKWNHEAFYYPGNAYVDVIGLTGYNTGTYHEGEVWRSFQQIYEVPYERALKYYDKPLMITEFASSSVGGDKAAWVEDMFIQMQNYHQIKAAIWWSGRDLDSNGNVARPYWLDENDNLVKIFQKNLSQ